MNILGFDGEGSQSRLVGGCLKAVTMREEHCTVQRALVGWISPRVKEDELEPESLELKLHGGCAQLRPCTGTK